MQDKIDKHALNSGVLKLSHVLHLAKFLTFPYKPLFGAFRNREIGGPPFEVERLVKTTTFSRCQVIGASMPLAAWQATMRACAVASKWTLGPKDNHA